MRLLVEKKGDRDSDLSVEGGCDKDEDACDALHAAGGYQRGRSQDARAKVASFKSSAPRWVGLAMTSTKDTRAFLWMLL